MDQFKTTLQRCEETRRQMSVRQQLVSAMVGISVLAMLIAVGCGGGGTGVAQPGSNAYRIPFIAANDVAYIDAIVPHHEHALEMAQMEIDKGTRAQVKTMAQRMKTMQMAEITMLKNARKAITGSETVPSPPTDPHGEADMARLRAATGAQVDKEFLDHMIPHHAEGISIAHRAYPNLSRPDLIANANEVYNMQSREIGEMIALRGNIPQTGR